MEISCVGSDHLVFFVMGPLSLLESRETLPLPPPPRPTSPFLSRKTQTNVPRDDLGQRGQRALLECFKEWLFCVKELCLAAVCSCLPNVCQCRTKWGGGGRIEWNTMTRCCTPGLKWYETCTATKRLRDRATSSILIRSTLFWTEWCVCACACQIKNPNWNWCGCEIVTFVWLSDWQWACHCLILSWVFACENFDLQQCIWLKDVQLKKERKNNNFIMKSAPLPITIIHFICVIWDRFCGCSKKGNYWKSFI